VSDAAHVLLVLRHGESEWNALDLFTGWVDVGLSRRGAEEAARAGRLLRDRGVLPDVVHTSMLRRAIRTAEIALDACDRHWVPVRRSWRLNERHYGDLQGWSKRQTLARYGEAQFSRWRRSYDEPMPPTADGAPLSQFHDPRYAGLPPELRPRSERLKDVVHRLLPYWYDALVPDLRTHGVVAVVAHGNSLRALAKHLEGISDRDIATLEIPTGIPFVYGLDTDFRPLARHYLEATASPSRSAGE
jgi:2,3-bisphosphoglycerate-dependent phosphoglycerate mutase